MGKLTPHLEILPASQREVWEYLGLTPEGFVLYGGTALALRLGHRESIDFDFFSRQSFRPLELVSSISYLQDQEVIQQSENTLSCDIGTGKGSVRISFFGGLTLGQIDPPDRAENNNIAVASLKDIFGTKCATVPQRNEIKDYLGIHALIVQGRVGLSEGIASAKAIYGRRYNPVLTLQALAYFDDLPEPLPQNVKTDLRAAVQSVSLQDLPSITASSRIGEGVGEAS